MVMETKKMLPSPSISNADEKCKKERLWQINNRLANKHGYCHNVYWVHGDIYRGKWEHNKRDGAGIHTYKSGNRYEGGWKNGERDGFGTSFLIHPPTDKYRVVYKGYWKAGKKDGSGLLYGSYGETYEGNFARGMRNGFGKQAYLCWRTGGYHIYYGQWVNDKREGVGTLRLVNGNVYRGSFVGDMKEGKGVYYYGDKCSKYEGLWRKDVGICGTYSSMSEEDKHLPFLEIHNFDSFVPKLMNEYINSNLVKSNSFTSLSAMERSKLLQDFNR